MSKQDKENAVFHAEQEFDKILSKIHPDWEIIIRLSDFLRANEDDVSIALTTKIYEIIKHEKNAKVVWITLVVLDTLVKYGPDCFVDHVATVDFMQAMIKIIKKRWVKRKKETLGPNYKNLCGEWAVHMVHDWGAMYPAIWSSRVPIFNQTFNLCVSQGIQFPSPADRPKDMTPPPSKTLHQKSSQSYRKSPKRDQIKNNDVRGELNAAANALALLIDIIKNTPKYELEKQEIGKVVVDQLVVHEENLKKFANENLENESILGEILGTHDRVHSALERYHKACKNPDPSESSSDGDDHIVVGGILPPQKPPSRRNSKNRRSSGSKRNQTSPPPQQPNPFLHPINEHGPTVVPLSSSPVYPSSPIVYHPTMVANPSSPFNSNGPMPSSPFNSNGPMPSSPFNSNGPMPSSPFNSNGPNPFVTNPFLTGSSPAQPFNPFLVSSNPFGTPATSPLPHHQPVSPQPRPPTEYVNSVPHTSQPGIYVSAPPPSGPLINPFDAFPH